MRFRYFDFKCLICMPLFFVGCNSTEKPETVATEKVVAVAPSVSKKKQFEYVSTVTNEAQNEVEKSLAKNLTDDTARLMKLVDAKSSLDAFDKYTPLETKAKNVESDLENARKYKEAENLLINDITYYKMLIGFVKIDDKSLSSYKIAIRDAYRKKYADKYELTYVNELVAPYLEEKAKMLQYKISDDVVNGIKSRFSLESIYQTATKQTKEISESLADEIAEKSKPK